MTTFRHLKKNQKIFRQYKGKKLRQYFNYQFVQKENQRQDFINELRKTMLNDSIRTGGTNSLLREGRGDNYYLTRDGKITDTFNAELQQIGEEQALIFQKQQLDAFPPTEDCFGIQRHFCSICRQDCKGYQSSNFLFSSSTQVRGEFPTFCKQCSCPAYFHKETDRKIVFPNELVEIVQANNIQSNDINWNCAMAVFVIEHNTKNKLDEAINFLKDEGLEVISFTQKHISAEEAFMIRSRVVDAQFDDQNTALNANFKKVSTDNEIKSQISQNQFLTSKLDQANPFHVEVNTQEKEQMMKFQLQTQKIGLTPKNAESQNTDPNRYLVSPSNQASLKPSIQGIQHLDTVQEESDDDFERATQKSQTNLTINQETGQKDLKTKFVFKDNEVNRRLLPSMEPNEIRLKVVEKNMPQAKTKKVTQHELDEQTQIEFLVRCVKKNELLQTLLKNEIVFLILSSSQIQNLTGAIRNASKNWDNTVGTRLLYFSRNKIHALEDSVQFVPHLFRLTKSIIVAEQISLFTDGLQDTRFSKDSYLGRLVDRQAADEIDVPNHIQKPQDNHFSNRQTHCVQSKLSLLNKQLHQNRTQQKKIESKQETRSRGNSNDSLDSISQASWVQRAKERDVKGTRKNKEQALLKTGKKIYYNYGVMRDVLNYSGMSLQVSHQFCDFQKPLRPQGLIGGNGISVGSQEFAVRAIQPCNIFAIAKVGLPTLIMPNTLDLKYSNYENYESYTKISDMFFPDNYISHQSIMILRPVMVRNQLNNLVTQILRANEFLILKKKIRPLTGGEIAYLANKEKIPEENRSLYYNIMAQGPCEILVLSKFSGVHDAKTLLNGAAPHGRRRLNQQNEDKSDLRTNVDSVNAMFEIAPFTSFSELLDLQDFLGRNNKLSKFQNENKDQFKSIAQESEQLKKLILQFSRHFNFVGYSSEDINTAQQDLCVFVPEISSINEVILVLNTIYNDIVEDVFELLIRQGYQILKHEQKQMKEEQVKSLFESKIDFQSQDGRSFVFNMVNAQDRTHIFHLTKVAGDLETRNLYLESDLSIEDLVSPSRFDKPLKSVYIPFIFLFLDTPQTFEFGLQLIYKSEYAQFNGQQLFHYTQTDQFNILQTCLLVTVGDTIKILQTDILGQQKALKKQKTESFEPISQFSLFSRDGKLEPQFLMTTFDDNNGKIKNCSFQVESSNHGIFEVRIHTAQHFGESCEAIQQKLLQQFSTLSLYYNEASKVTSNIVPAFYKYKIAHNLNRVYEVEEYMGDNFMEGIAKLHIQHQKITEMNMKFSVINKQKSMPAYVFGIRISQMCKQLKEIKTKYKGAGYFSYDETIQEFVGEVPQVTTSNYYFYDKQRYLGFLNNFKKGWLYYISSLEADIIEMKLMIILNSLTFRYSRQPEYLKLVPERITGNHLRISEQIKAVNQEALDPNSLQKFFKPDTTGIIDPNREKEVSSKVESIMQTIKAAKAKALADHQKNLQNSQTQSKHKEVKDYSIHNDISICGFLDGVARRPSIHLLAAVMWVLNFEYRKINRTPQYLVGDRNYNQVKNLIETEYDEILDIILSAALEDYHKDNLQALDVFKIRNEQPDTKIDSEPIPIQVNKNLPAQEQLKQQLKQQIEAEQAKKMKQDIERKKDIQHQIEIKQKFEAKMLQKIQDELEDRKRFARTTMSIEDLIKTEVHGAADKAQQQQRNELKEFLQKKGGSDKDGTEFMNFVEKSKVQFGPYANKLAEQFAKNQALKQAAQSNPQLLSQEMISFAKMEYFLYGCAEANHIISDLKVMEDKLIVMNESQNCSQLLVKDLEKALRLLQHDQRIFNDRKILTEKLNSVMSEIVTMEESMLKFRLEISTKETELLSIFRELMATEFYVPDDFFNKETSNEFNFKIPTQNFWIPVKIENERYETNLNSDQYKKPIEAMPNLKQNYGKFISDHLKNTILSYPQTSDRLDSLAEGTTIQGLHDPEITEKPKSIAFDKFSSAAEAKMQKNLELQEALVKEKGKKVSYAPDVLFKKQ